MGVMVDGVWRDIPRDQRATGGAFIRPESQFREQLTVAGGGRYHLYVSRACPWAHRTLVVRALKGLEKAVPVFYANPYMAENGWEFSPGVNSARIRYLHELYAQARPGYTGRVTVPALCDSRSRTIVNNESAEIIRMLNGAFDGLATRKCADLYPRQLRKEIDAVNERVYRTVNNGVYRAGFATAQDKYEQAVTALFATLGWLGRRLAKRRRPCGGGFTQTDVRPVPTPGPLRSVYYSPLKLQLPRIPHTPEPWCPT